MEAVVTAVVAVMVDGAVAVVAMEADTVAEKRTLKKVLFFDERIIAR